MNNILRFAVSGVLFAILNLQGPCCFAADTLRLTLSDCIHFARENGATAKVVHLGYQSRKAQNAAIKADFYPQISFNVDIPGYQRAIVPVLQPNATFDNLPQSYAYSQGSLSLFQKIPFSGGDITVMSGLNNRVNFTGERNEFWSSFPFLIQVRQPLFGVNHYQNARDLESIQFDVATREYLEQLEDASIDAAGKYFDYYIAMMNIDNALLNVAINDSMYTLAKGRYNVGKIAENDLSQTELALISAQTDFERASLEADRSLKALKLALGITEITTLSIIPPEKTPEFTVDGAKALEYAIAYRSDIKNLEAQSMQSEQVLAQAQADNRFSANLVASYGMNQTAGRFGDVYRNPLDQEQISLGLQVPLFTWGKGSATIEQAFANQQRTKIQASYQKSQFGQEVEFQVKDFLQLQKQISIAQKGEQIAVRGYEVARNRYIIGKIETTELMLAQQRKDASRREYFQTLRSFWTSYYRLRRLTLWDFATNSRIMPNE